MLYEGLTDRARKIVALANQEAQRYNHEYIGPEHILLGVIKEGSGVGANVLKNLKVDLKKARQEVEKLVKPGIEPVGYGRLPHPPATKRVFEVATEYARALNHNYVGTEHITYALSTISSDENIVGKVFENLNVNPSDLESEIEDLLGVERTKFKPQGLGDLETEIRGRMGEKALAESQLAISVEGGKASFSGELTLDKYREYFPGDKGYVPLYILAREVDSRLATVIEKIAIADSSDVVGAKQKLLRKLLEVVQESPLKEE